MSTQGWKMRRTGSRGRAARALRALAVAALVLLLTACTPGSGATPGATPGPTPDGGSDVPVAEPTVDVTPSDEPPADAGRDDLGLADGEFPDPDQLEELGPVALCAYAGPEYCEDANGNTWPDFVEEELGRDPTVDECVRTGCDAAGLDVALEEMSANTLIILDASGSMAGDAGGGLTKMEAARRALTAHVAGTPEFVDLGLMVYGHRGDNSDAGRAESCTGIETFAPVGGLDHTNVEQVVRSFDATGWTPIGAALDAAGPLLAEAAAQDVDGTSNNRIILISDGLETCDGDPVASAQALGTTGVDVVVDVIGFDLPEADRGALESVASVTGGRYVDVVGGDALLGALDAYNQEYGDLVAALECQFTAMTEVRQCGADLRVQAIDVMHAIRDELFEEGDIDRGAFIGRWAVAAGRVEDDRLDRMADELRRDLDAIVTAIEESNDRRREALGGTSAQRRQRRVAVICPLEGDDHGPHGALASA